MYTELATHKALKTNEKPMANNQGMAIQAISAPPPSATAKSMVTGTMAKPFKLEQMKNKINYKNDKAEIAVEALQVNRNSRHSPMRRVPAEIMYRKIGWLARTTLLFEL